MNALVVFDSHYGNTEQIARAIAFGISDQEEVKVKAAPDVEDADLLSLELLVVGSPTIAWRVASPIKDWFDKTLEAKFHRVPAAAFDTGFKSRLSGSAAKGIDRRLRRKGCHVIAAPNRFFVTGLSGPLMEGELERATRWGKAIRISREHAMEKRIA